MFISVHRQREAEESRGHLAKEVQNSKNKLKAITRQKKDNHKHLQHLYLVRMVILHQHHPCRLVVLLNESKDQLHLRHRLCRRYPHPLHRPLILPIVNTHHSVIESVIVTVINAPILELNPHLQLVQVVQILPLWHLRHQRFQKLPK